MIGCSDMRMSAREYSTHTGSQTNFVKFCQNLRTRGLLVSLTEYCPLLVWRVISPQAGAECAHSMGGPPLLWCVRVHIDVGLVRAGLEGMKVETVPMANAPTRFVM